VYDDAGERDGPMLSLHEDPGRADEEVPVELVDDVALEDLVRLDHFDVPS
jgi:hypothetical protein